MFEINRELFRGEFHLRQNILLQPLGEECKALNRIGLLFLIESNIVKCQHDEFNLLWNGFLICSEQCGISIDGFLCHINDILENRRVISTNLLSDMLDEYQDCFNGTYIDVIKQVFQVSSDEINAHIVKNVEVREYNCDVSESIE